MLTRRHIRTKVMQSIYAYNQSKKDQIGVEEKFLNKSIHEMYDLFILNLDLIIQVKNQAKKYYELSQKKHLATPQDKAPNLKFVENQLIHQLENCDQLQLLIEDRKLRNWKDDPEIPRNIWDELFKSELYKSYLEDEFQSYKEDKDFVIQFYKKVLAPNDSLYEYYEDHKLTWLDDFPIVNTSIIKFLKHIKKEEEISIPTLFKNFEDKKFAGELFKKTVLNYNELLADTDGKTPGWEKDRIAEIDQVLICMALAEFKKFPSIPVKVTINEYLEIAKEYSTPKSSYFINGVLDKIAKDYKENDKLNKVGRGLM
ncbi:MAG: transcription antitermination protein NusB [Flavobacteriaceae bacterium]|nr:transcription antitermination protein NusB [Flavobacteriaceae bacterium]